MGEGGLDGDRDQDAPARAVVEGRPRGEDVRAGHGGRARGVEPAGEVGPVRGRERRRTRRGEEDPGAVEEIRGAALGHSRVEAPAGGVGAEPDRDEPGAPVARRHRPDRRQAPAVRVVVGGEHQAARRRPRGHPHRLHEPVGGGAPVGREHRAGGAGRVHHRAGVRGGHLPGEDHQHAAELLLHQPIGAPGLGEAGEGHVHRGELRGDLHRAGPGAGGVLGGGPPRQLPLRGVQDGEGDADERGERRGDDEEGELALEGHRSGSP